MIEFVTRNVDGHLVCWEYDDKDELYTMAVRNETFRLAVCKLTDDEKTEKFRKLDIFCKLHTLYSGYFVQTSFSYCNLPSLSSRIKFSYCFVCSR